MAPDMMSVHRNPNVSNWSLENGYSDEVNATNYPIRVFNAKQGAALVVFLGLFIDDLEYVCRSLVPGFKIYLHAPGEVSLLSHKSFRLPLSEEAELSIKPTLVHTSDGLRSYTPNERNCFFGSERRLRFFKVYNKNSCQAECLANFTLLSCGCVKFSMPSMNWIEFLTAFLSTSTHFQSKNSKKYSFLFRRIKKHKDLWCCKFRLLSSGRTETLRWRCNRWH